MYALGPVQAYVAPETVAAVKFKVPPAQIGLLLPAVGVPIELPPTTTVFVTIQLNAFVNSTVYVPAAKPVAVFAPATPVEVETTVPAAFVQT